MADQCRNFGLIKRFNLLDGIKYVERGYAQVPEKLASLGAAIKVREREASSGGELVVPC